MSEYLRKHVDNNLQATESVQQQVQTVNHSQQMVEQSKIQQLKQSNSFHPFYIFPLLYVISFYVVPVLFAIVQETPIASYILYVPIIFGVLNIIVSVKFCKPENRIMLLNAAVLVKYAMIPFFIIGSLVVILSLLVSFIPVPFMIFLGPALTIAEVIVGWLVLAFGAPYTICYLYLDSKVHIRSKFMIAIHIILQFFFTLDVIDVMILTLRERRWKKLTICIIIALAVVIILFLFLIVWGLAGILMKGL